MRPEVNILAMVKGQERFVYIYDDASHAALLDHLAEQAFDPSLSLTGFDAAVLAQRSREQLETASASISGSEDSQ